MPEELERAIELIGGQVALLVLAALFEVPRRLSDLRTVLPDVDAIALLKRLSLLEESGLVRRQVFDPHRSVQVYEVTKCALEMRPAMEALALWAGQP